MDNQMEDSGRSPTEPGCQPTASAAEEASSLSGIPNAVGARRGFELISAHIDYLERENLRLSELLTTYYVNALRGDADSLATFIKDYGHDVHRDRKTLSEAIGEFQARRAPTEDAAHKHTVPHKDEADAPPEPSEK